MQKNLYIQSWCSHHENFHNPSSWLCQSYLLTILVQRSIYACVIILQNRPKVYECLSNTIWKEKRKICCTVFARHCKFVIRYNCITYNMMQRLRKVSDHLVFCPSFVFVILLLFRFLAQPSLSPLQPSNFPFPSQLFSRTSPSF